MKLEITAYIPQFPWFYESILDDLIDREEEYIMEDNDIKDYDELTDKFDINYTETFNNISKDYYNIFEDIFAKGLNDEVGIELLWFDHLFSPKYYNNDTDALFAKVSVDKKKLYKYINDNKEAFSKKIKEENTGCDGFVPHFENDFDRYVNAELEDSMISQIIDFYLEEIGYSDSSDYVVDRLQWNGINVSFKARKVSE